MQIERLKARGKKLSQAPNDERRTPEPIIDRKCDGFWYQHKTLLYWRTNRADCIGQAINESRTI